ncbi:MAG: NtaA/DmoA family FMN-dependent monooxygenase [Terriglobales bacterium]
MFHMGWFMGYGFSLQDWDGVYKGSMVKEWMKGEFIADVLASLERAGFDYLLIEDTCMVQEYNGSMELTLKYAKAAPKNDPVPLVPLLTQRTKHIGVAVTMSTSFYHPFMAARSLATLDHLTDGRVGVNIVTSSSDLAAQNFGYDTLPAHAERYEKAHEWMEACTALWESWEPDAVIGDNETPMYADHTKVHTVNFEGKYFKTRGPLVTTPGPQGKPVIVQAGASEAGRELAARFAESMLAHSPSVPEMRAFREDMHARMAKYGRDPSELKILFLIDPVMGESEVVAQDRMDRKKAAGILASQESIELKLAGMSNITGGVFRPTLEDLDKPVPDIMGNGETSTWRVFVEESRGKTLREAFAGQTENHAGLGLVGTHDSVAAQMGEIMEEVGGDGFLVSPEVTRHQVAEVADGLAPALRRRGLIRDGYEHSTFRENLLAF